jgi:hypothetical protein
MAKKLKKYQATTKTKSNEVKPSPKRKVPETPVLGDDISISNALRRLALDPSSAENWVNQGARLMIQPVRPPAELVSKAMRMAGNKKEIAFEKQREGTYQAQKKLLQQELKNKYGFSFKKGGSVKSKPKSKKK